MVWSVGKTIDSITYIQLHKENGNRQHAVRINLGSSTFVAGKVMDVSRWEDIPQTSASFAIAHIRVRGYIGTLP